MFKAGHHERQIKNHTKWYISRLVYHIRRFHVKQESSTSLVVTTLQLLVQGLVCLVLPGVDICFYSIPTDTLIPRPCYVISTPE